MITWTTYGSWLQGDKRGYVKDSRILVKNESLRKGNIKRLKADPVELNHREREIVYEAIVDSAKILGQKIHAIVVCSNHVHIVAQRTSESIEMVVSRYKNAARLALQANGFVGRVWKEVLTSDSVSTSSSCKVESSTCKPIANSPFSPQVHLGGLIRGSS